MEKNRKRGLDQDGCIGNKGISTQNSIFAGTDVRVCQIVKGLWGDSQSIVLCLSFLYSFLSWSLIPWFGQGECMALWRSHWCLRHRLDSYPKMFTYQIRPVMTQGNCRLERLRAKQTKPTRPASPCLSLCFGYLQVQIKSMLFINSSL